MKYFILQGAGYRIAFGAKYYHRKKSVTIDIPFYEHGWFHFPKVMINYYFHEIIVFLFFNPHF